MPVVSIPIEDLGLKWHIWKHLSMLGVRSTSDLAIVPETVLIDYYSVLMEAIDRVKRENAQPQD